MPRYMFRASYTASGAAGLLAEGGTARAAAVTKMVESVGGTVETMDWAFGADDFFMIASVPDAEAAAVASLTVGASGAVSVTSAELLSAAQLDEVARRRAEYRPPGG